MIILHYICKMHTFQLFVKIVLLANNLNSQSLAKLKLSHDTYAFHGFCYGYHSHDIKRAEFVYLNCYMIHLHNSLSFQIDQIIKYVENPSLSPTKLHVPCLPVSSVPWLFQQSGHPPQKSIEDSPRKLGARVYRQLGHSSLKSMAKLVLVAARPRRRGRVLARYMAFSDHVSSSARFPISLPISLPRPLACPGTLPHPINSWSNHLWPRTPSTLAS